LSYTILIIEDEEVLARNMAVYLGRHNFNAQVANSAEQGLASLEELRPDAVILDFNLPGMDGLRALARIRAFDGSLPVLMVTGHGNVELAVEAMKAGAVDFLTKPVALSKLRLLLERAIGDLRREQALDYYQRREAQGLQLQGLLGDSPPMLAFKQTLAQLLQAEAGMRDGDAPAVLVLGDTGTGKEMVARALHFQGTRQSKPFVELNCAALPAQLLESELFGHERGAFTDARERKLGIVETAEGGTLFLDEIGDMDLVLQAKLLKLLEEKTIRRIGSLREQRVDVRIIAATHRPLELLVAEGRFRADLFFRLGVVKLQLPPLRDRSTDIVSLAQHFLQVHAARYGKSVPELSPEALHLLQDHHWPGNVRELKNVIEQAVLLSSGPVIAGSQLAHLQRQGGSVTSAPSHLTEQASSQSTAQAVLSGSVGSGPRYSLADLERQALVQALRQNDGNVSRAARALGISRDTLRYRIEKYQLEASAVNMRRGAW
jgi:two-component system, NtrC family, response regulator AtoC